MSLYIDMKYVGLVSPQLERFKRKSEYLWNFRCPLCGDSAKNKFKARGYFYRKKSNLFFQCHNCSSSLSLGNFIKSVNSTLYEEYRFERYREESNGRNVSVPKFVEASKTKPVFNLPKKINLPTIASLPNTHSAKKFLMDRKIPSDKFDQLYFAFDFKKFVFEWAPQYDGENSEYKNLHDEDERIIIPFYDTKKVLSGFQGRSRSNSGIRYITIKLNDETQKFYGLSQLDFSKKIRVVEGPFDAMFLPNSVAVMDAALERVIPAIGPYDYVFIFDNEKLNKQVVRHMTNVIELEKDIFIWPSHIHEKDINDLIKAGYSQSEIISLIEDNTFSGLNAQLKFSLWKK